MVMVGKKVQGNRVASRHHDHDHDHHGHHLYHHNNTNFHHHHHHCSYQDLLSQGGGSN